MKALLSIDGGGLRGLVPARFLSVLEARAGKRCFELFDFAAGCSTGGILALGLTVPSTQLTGRTSLYSAADLVALYREQGGKIFSRPVEWELKTVDGVAGPKYPADGIESVLASYFAGHMLEDALIPVLVVGYDTQDPGPKLFKSWSMGSLLMRDVARCTSAAPTYFPAKDGRYIDGGVAANNPALVAWSARREVFKPEAIADVLVVSLGTGNTNHREDPTNWGLIQWAPWLVNTFMGGDSDVMDLVLRNELPPERYFRFQADLGTVSQAMDDASPATVDALIGVADKMVEANAKQIDQLLSAIA